MKKITIMTPCYNEEKNVEDLYLRVKEVFHQLPNYEYEHLFIDNASQDKTVDELKKIAQKDSRVKVIVNARNFGPVRSGYYGILQCYGDAVIFMVADLQDPPELILEFVKKWEEGYKVVKAVKTPMKEGSFFYFARQIFYYLMDNLSDIKVTRNFTGFGLYDQKVINVLREINDPYPYFRGLIEELGFESFSFEYQQQRRKRGISSYNFYRYYSEAMLGITSHSQVPLRLATMLGFALSLLSLLVALGYLMAKLLFWDYFPLGTAPIMVGLFLIASVQLFFIGIIGEYIGLMHMRILKRPLVVERERINFQ
ncbi:MULTISPECIES: glycosyltransferase family 2 protein [unclassified Microcystis]|uniref:glycosyltransferase family 2 protein n=1 Tax=unclassified Microcystis TaxID=2643300 RepID=UPI0022C4083D|nr:MULTISPECIES: glycosyltransferase family 2 protein [unclassified Microcystis]MCA2691084.1 glycosyltransferase family 2 protein [Microcystis sp. M034S2]MCA2752531.1 glycosyltransferase family 2 protein [Microcystis sp. M144S2]MCZ8201635.1 glycosyltransferase family 2 protein [Microcystis sp. LE19-55.1A]MCZ8308503.1 glycosyltransferase family 2 protein [Microcystis sp. LE19-98.1E]